MAIIINLDVMLAKRKMKSKELAEINGITTANISILQSGKAKAVRAGKDIIILCFGPLLETCKSVAEELNASLIDMRFIKPIDETIIIKNALSHRLVVTVEDNTVKGGAGSAVLEVLSQQQISCNTLCLGIPDKFLEHGSQEEVHKICGLDKNGILSKIVNHINK